MAGVDRNVANYHRTCEFLHLFVLCSLLFPFFPPRFSSYSFFSPPSHPPPPPPPPLPPPLPPLFRVPFFRVMARTRSLVMFALSKCANEALSVPTFCRKLMVHRYSGFHPSFRNGGMGKWYTHCPKSGDLNCTLLAWIASLIKSVFVNWSVGPRVAAIPWSFEKTRPVPSRPAG